MIGGAQSHASTDSLGPTPQSPRAQDGKLALKLSIGVKALNEERHIAQSLSSALEAAAPFDGEVILADSGSTDQTLTIARQYAVRIVQLVNTDERCCGAGAQLAYQHALGEFFYLLDGDMVLKPDFVAAGIAFLEQHPDYAAVGGLVTEMNTQAEEFQIRAKTVRKGRNWLPGDVDQLDCGGLYRVAAIRELGYFADRNLHAFEEFELGARLRSRGWKLARIGHPAISHYGHQIGGYSLLWRRLTSGYLSAPGEVLRAALGKRHLPLVLRRLGHLRVGLLVLAWWTLLFWLLVGPLAASQKLGVTGLLLLAPLSFLIFRRGSWRLGLYSLAAWNVNTLGLLRGLVRRRARPDMPIASQQVDLG
jgi:GT2 family glycosyltransferase